MINEELVCGRGGEPLVWIIDENCLYDLPVLAEHVSMFTESDRVLDVSDLYPEHDEITVRFIKDGQTVEDFQTSEYFGNVLLSNPQVESLQKYPYGQYVESPNAKFDGKQFIITNRNLTGYLAWHVESIYAPADYFDNFQG
jgi:hypothetical protein